MDKDMLSDKDVLGDVLDDVLGDVPALDVRRLTLAVPTFYFFCHFQFL